MNNNIDSKNDIDPKIKLFLVDIELTVSDIPVFATNSKEAEEIANDHFEEEMRNDGDATSYAKEITSLKSVLPYIYDCLPYSNKSSQLSLTCKEFIDIKSVQIEKDELFAEMDKKQVKFDFYDDVNNA